MLQQSDFLLQLLWEISEIILLHHVLFFVCCHSLSFVVIELRTRGLCHNLGGVVEEHTGRHVRQQVAEAVFGGIVYPLGDPHLCGLVNGHLVRVAGSLRPLTLWIVIHLNRLLRNLLPG